MNKTIITVPKGITYISDWTNFSLQQGHYIIDKKVTGCGFTQYCITNNLPTILCSPRKILLENKADQHSNVFYVRNELEKALRLDIDLNQKDDKKINEEKIQDEDYLNNLIFQIQEYTNKMVITGKSPKILVTYDSLKHVLRALGENTVKNFYIVVDEFQSIFTDSRFKGEVEMDFVEYLQDCPNVCYVSATPYMEEYLNLIPQFKNLPYYELDWKKEDPIRVCSTSIDVKNTRTPIKDICSIIQSYLDGDFPKGTILENGIPKVILSKELVIYVNSVRSICSIVKKMGLTSSQTNILCARTKDNITKLKRLKHQIGSVPINPNNNKMFTFCTRTVYLGADFYSTNAMSIILSDSNIECMAVDIKLDLPQILGRQRLDCNPWKTRALMFCRITKTPSTPETLEKILDKKTQQTFGLLDIINKDDIVSNELQSEALSRVYLQNINTQHYSYDYLGISRKTGKFVFNNLIKIAEIRAFEVIQKDYKDWVCVLNHIQDSVSTLSELSNPEIDNFINKFNSLRRFDERLKLYCETEISEDVRKMIDPQISIEYSNFYKSLGPSICKSKAYKRGELQKEYDNRYVKESNNSFIDLIKSEFPISNSDGSSIFYPNKDIKQKLQKIYVKHEITEKAKATDIIRFFEANEVVKRIGKQIVRGYYLLKFKLQ